MYESPINAIYHEITHKILEDSEEKIMLGVQQAVGYKVDKDELIKALRYDRNQYEKGFEDGIAQMTKWIPCSEKLPKEFESILVCYKSQGGIAQAVSERLTNMDGSNRWSALAGAEPIAWMPLPEPYKAESEVT